jgi:hypothetical protein
MRKGDLMSDSETFAHRVLSAREAVSRTPSASPGPTRLAGLATQHKRALRRNKEQLRKEVIAAWRDWVRAQALQKIRDVNIHAFLRQVKAQQPDLLDFPSRLGCYEAAFGWIVNDKSVGRGDYDTITNVSGR